MSVEIPNMQSSGADTKFMKKFALLAVGAIVLGIVIMLMFKYRILLVLAGALFALLAFTWLKKKGVIV